MKTNNKSENKEEILIKSIKGGKGVKKMSLSEITSYLKDNKVDVNELDSHGYNMLHYAIKSENADVVQILLSLDPENYLTEKADPNINTADAKNDVNLPPLLLTLQYVNDFTVCFKIIKMLIKKDADVNAKDDNACNVFLRACEKGKIDILDFILCNDQLQNNISQLCPNGSALHMAIIGDQEDTISFLLQNKIDITLRDAQGNTALHIALQLKMNNSFKLIQDFIISSREILDEVKHLIFNAQNEEGNTILHELAYAKSQFLIEMIRKFPQAYAVDPELKNKEGYTYKGVQENIVKLQNLEEEREKLMKEEIRKQKELLAEEKKQELLREKEEEEKSRIAEEQREKLGLVMLKYRGWIFALVFVIFMFLLFFVVSNATKKKEKIIY